MRRFALAVVLSGVAVLPFVGCGSSTPSNTGKAGHDGGAGAGGAGTTGGAGAGGAGTTGNAGSGGAGTGGLAGNDGGAAGTTTDGGDAATDASDAAPLTAEQSRGSYLVNSVLGCNGCHQTPKTATAAAVVLGGNDCFAKDTGGGCLASANLTNDATGIKNLSDQQIIDAFTKGLFPDKVDGGTVYLFANMPYYQFSNLTMADASAIVAYLRTIAGSSHTVAANTGTFATRPTAAQWTPITVADLPMPVAADGGTDAGADAGDAGAADAGTPPSTSNGKYMAALMCSVCHTVNTAAVAPAPLQLDATKAFQGGKKFNTTLTVPADGGVDGGDAGADAGADAGDAGPTMTIMKEIQSANLTPDVTGLKTWTAAQILTAIKKGQDEAGRTICTPMRPFPTLTDKDGLDIAAYLQAIPAATNAITETCE